MMRKFQLMYITFISFTVVECKILDTSNAFLSRHKRYLIWHEGINWVQMILGIGLPFEIQDQSVTMGAAIKAYYLLPTNSSDYTRPSIDYARKKRSTSRWTAYQLLENFMNQYGYGEGKACVLRSICEAASLPFEEKSGILAEIVHVLLTPSSTQEALDSYSNTEYHAAESLGKEANNCGVLFPECKRSVVEQFTRYLK